MKRNSLKFLKMGVIALLVFMQVGVSAQEEFLTKRTKDIDREHRVKKRKIKKVKVHKDATYVNVNNVLEHIEGGELTFRIPNEKKAYTAVVRKFEYESPSNFAWEGDIKGEYGEVYLLCADGLYSGVIRTEEGEYEIGVANGKSIVIKYDKKEMGKLARAAIELDDTDMGDDLPLPLAVPNSDCTGNVRVLFVYTTNAKNAKGGKAAIESAIRTAISQSNSALNASGISPNQLYFSIAGMIEKTFTETPDVSDELSYLLGITYSDRTEKGADLVVLVGDAKYYVMKDGSRVYADGAAYLGVGVWKAYSVVRVTALTSRYTVVHELAHNFRCRHEWDNDPDGDFEHAHDFQAGGNGYITTMHHPKAGYTEIKNFSNPNKTYNGVATGKTDRDNARQLVEKSCIIESYRPYDPPPTVYISGTVRGQNNVDYTWTAHASGGETPYSYLWQYSLNGTTYYNVGTTQSITQELPYNNDLYLKVTVTDDNGNTATDYFVTINTSVHGGGL